MEGVGARLGRSSTRYGPATVFTGPVRKWKKKWVHVTPPNTAGTGASSNNNNHHHHHQASINSNGDSSSNGSNDNGSHLMLYKWTPIAQSQSADNVSNGDAKEDGATGDEDEEPPRRKIKYIPIALLEEQKNESPDEEHIDESVETDPNTKVDDVDGKPDINDVPMEENEASEDTNGGKQDLNESKLDLNARDGNEDGEETEDQEL